MLATPPPPNDEQPSQKTLEYNRGTGLRMGILALVFAGVLVVAAVCSMGMAQKPPSAVESAMVKAVDAESCSSCRAAGVNMTTRWVA